MSCQKSDGLVDAYFDGELDVIRAVEFEDHLKSCSECRATISEYDGLRKSLRAGEMYFAVRESLEAKVREQLSGANGRNRPSPFRRWRPLIAFAAAAVLVVITMVAVEAFRRSSHTTLLADQVVSGHVRSLMANHMMDVVSTDQHTVKPWFSGKLDFSPVVKDLAAQGFPLAGGRLDYLDGHPAAALLYRRRQHVINLFIWPTVQPDTSPKSFTRRGYNLISWTQAHMEYWAVSDLNARELQEFAHDAKQ